MEHRQNESSFQRDRPTAEAPDRLENLTLEKLSFVVQEQGD